ncbi:MAG: AAA family ATPase [Acidobacteria bacterium]|nr:AAA family ATPase [Acidobacteriota bacterium]
MTAQDRSGVGNRLAPEQLRWRCDPKQFPFEVTAEIGECPIDIIGQPRAMSALKVGFDLRSDGYNIFVAGEVGTGRSTAVRKIQQGLQRKDGPPEDLVYVHNFRDRDQPRLLAFPAGKGCAFGKAMEEMVDSLRKRLPALEQFRKERGELVEAVKERQKKRLKKFEGQVEKRGFTVVQAQLGPLVRPVLLPVVGGKPADLDQLESQVEEKKFAREDFDRIREQHIELAGEMEEVFKDLRKMERKLKKDLEALDRSIAGPVVREAVDEIREAFAGEAVGAYLDQVREDILENLDRFREAPDPEAPGVDRDEARAALTELRLPYSANVIVDHRETEGRPVIWETAPTYRNLFGAIERVQDPSGQWLTDHTRIKAGSLARANGGYLVVDAMDLLQEAGVWPALKRALRTKRVETQSFDPLNIFAAVSLKPEPIPLDLKVVLIGTKHIYRLLYALDEDFSKIFKVKADFALETPLNEREMFNYACFVHKKCVDENLPPFHREAVAAIVEQGVRLAGRQQRLTTRFKDVADVVREAGYWARQEKAERVEVRHVDLALTERNRRVNMIEEELRDRIAEGTLILDLEGELVGQVNGLVVLDVGDHSFGQPARITAVTAMGRAGIVDIERESAMAGSIHTKGVLILAGFLRERFAQDKPLALSASLCFEQSYGLVEGDSASSAELYALLSSLSGIPIRQGIAVTGSVNQKGEIQPIGGVNEKVEGYFDLCRRRLLTRRQGVMIPTRNLPELMLRKDLVEEVRQETFHVWAVGDIESGIEILTGVPAGRRGADGTYPPDTIFGRVDAKLRALALGVREFGPADLKVSL